MKESPVVIASFHVELEQACLIGLLPRLSISASGVFVVLLSELEGFEGACLDCHMKQPELILVLSAKISAFSNEYFGNESRHLWVVIEVHKH